MREIIFRGKRADNGEWVYGNIVFTRSGRAFLLARQPGADERRMIMNELKSVETVMFFLAYISGVGVDYFNGTLMEQEG